MDTLYQPLTQIQCSLLRFRAEMIEFSEQEASIHNKIIRDLHDLQKCLLEDTCDIEHDICDKANVSFANGNLDSSSSGSCSKISAATFLKRPGRRRRLRGESQSHVESPHSSLGGDEGVAHLEPRRNLWRQYISQPERPAAAFPRNIHFAYKEPEPRSHASCTTFGGRLSAVDDRSTESREVSDMSGDSSSNSPFTSTAGSTELDPTLLQTCGVSEVLGLIGTGSFSRVYKCLVNSVEAPVALKVFVQPVHIDSLRNREMELLRGLVDHPNLVHLFSQTQESVNAILLEYCGGGSLHTFLHSNEKQPLPSWVDLRQRLHAMLDVASAVAYLHSEGIIHRDVKSGNCFLASQVPVNVADCKMPTVKLGDLNLSRSQSAWMTKGVGSVTYMAPEVMTSQQYDFSADIFSCGILLHELVTCSLPYSNIRTRKIAEARLIASICTGMRPPLDDVPIGATRGDLRALISSCWAAAPNERPSASALCAQVRSMQ
eukprot:gnl/TRDRNA2_/TRDRNA2_205572_c0_seq1.p1 gnl/TRDRNA2_/TRDRNA2_205572_c0~~gnl/TRDRNA2_/TRDRNA2_205572_c0_seq1.p1  ORF type:complete len:488 (-),score=48.47 gnl/TRDRNA2_/TRDRNA2_205572_c0_seq1:42-1505(-)